MNALKVIYEGDTLFEIDAAKLGEYVVEQEPTLGIWDASEPGQASSVSLLIDELQARGGITKPEGLRIYVLDDDGIDAAGLVVGVAPDTAAPRSLSTTAWPIVIEGWSELSNYLPTEEEAKRERFGEGTNEVAHARFIVERVLNAANAVLWQGKGGKPRADDTPPASPE